MNFKNIKTQDNTYIANTYARFDLGFASGKGAVCKDFEGKEYIDFTSGIGVNCLGFCDEDWAKAVATQAQTLNHTSNLYYSKPMAQLAELLCTKTGYQKVFFANSGAEANEGAIKTARKYSQDKYGEYKTDILTLVNSFHGRTITTLAATGQDVFHEKFLPLTQGFGYALANDFADVVSKITEKTCAIMIELVQGEGGVIPLEKDFVQKIAQICQEKDLLLIADEVQTGIGRTGTLLASEQFGIKPDITTLAKGLGAGLPIGAMLFSDKCQNTLGTSDHGSTFGGNPIACAGAKVVLEKITDEMLADINTKSQYIFDALKTIQGIKSVTGLGLMIGVEFENFAGKEVVEKCFEDGVVFLTAKNKLRMLPPFCITTEQIDKGLDAIKNAIK